MSMLMAASDRTQVPTSEITTIKIYSDQEDDMYYVDEEVILKADIGNPSAVRALAWHKQTTMEFAHQRRSAELENDIAASDVERGRSRESHAINTTSTKYLGSILKPECPLLKIRRCDMTDAGTYILLVSCKDLDIFSNEIHLTVKKGPPEVTLQIIPFALSNEFVEFKATVRCYPEQTRASWMKDNKRIDISNSRYEGSGVKGKSLLLCIKNVKKDGSGVYTIKVENALGEGQSSKEMKIVGVSEMFFLSGPVVVSPKKTITFNSKHPNRNPSDLKWWKTKDQSTKEIKIDNIKYLYTRDPKRNIHTFEITSAEAEDSATYFLSSNYMASNKVSVHVDDSREHSTEGQGNSIRLFALQAASADALRKVFHDKPGSFEVGLERIKKSYNSPKIPQIKSLRDADISLMYQMLRNLVEKPAQGWGKFPGENNINRADDIERIHQCKEFISHTDASEIETSVFNKNVLELFWAIRRLSKDDDRFIQNTCNILNKVFTTPESIEKIEKLKVFRKEQRYKDQMLSSIELDDGSHGGEGSIFN